MESTYEKYVGAVLDGRYKIEKVIGLGGMAVVFKAVDLKFNKTVAIKLLREDIAQEEESVKRFINESKAVAMLSHPNIVRIFAVSVKEDLKYIVMEYVEGISLKTYMQRKKIMSADETLKCSGQILNALDHAHEKGIVHRDIKPQNIMLMRNGQIKVTDFGIAKLPNAETVTMTDKAIGTVYYISPEQASGKQIDARSDLYSLGVTMYEMATGELPFNAESPVSVALMQVNEKAIPPKEINPELPAGLQDIINNAMEKDPEERYQSAKEMLSDVKALQKNPRSTFKNRNKKEEEKGFKAVAHQMLHGGSMLPIILGVTVPFIIILLIAGLIGINKLTDNNVKTETVVVDDFVGKYYDSELQSALKNSEIYKVEIKTKVDSEHEPGYILEQSPKAGSKKKVERGVTYCELTLTLSTSGEAQTVPKLNSFDRRDAELKLKSLGILFEVIEIHDDVYDSGKIVKTEPAGGEKIAAGERLKLYVSLGPDEGDIEAPDLEGLTASEALAKLQEKKLRIGNTTVEKSDKKEGTVIRQSPEPGTKLNENDKIDIVVSGGKDYDPEKGFDTDSGETAKKEDTTKKKETTKAPETTQKKETETVAPETTTQPPETTSVPEDTNPTPDVPGGDDSDTSEPELHDDSESDT